MSDGALVGDLMSLVEPCLVDGVNVALQEGVDALRQGRGAEFHEQIRLDNSIAQKTEPELQFLFSFDVVQPNEL